MKNMALDMSIDSIGIYPQATKRGDEWQYRTEWQEGWNAAVLALFQRHKWLTEWLTSLEPDALTAITELFEHDALFVWVNNGAVTCALNMNDTFGYATADCEEVPMEDVQTVARLWRDFGAAGMTAWAAVRRGDEPIEPRQTERYHAARKLLVHQ